MERVDGTGYKSQLRNDVGTKSMRVLWISFIALYFLFNWK